MSSSVASSSKRGPVVDVYHITVKESKLQSVDLLIGGDVSETEWQKKDHALEATFDPPHTYHSGLSSFTLLLHYRHRFPSLQKKDDSKDLIVDVLELVSGLKTVDGHGQEIRKEYGKTVVTIVVQLRAVNPGENNPSFTNESDLISTTANINRICPRFRILVIGNSGVGKSSLINAVFGVSDAKVAHSRRGEAEINHEFISDQNSHLVLHDSRGFEPGEVDNIQIVQQFMADRGKQVQIKDRLHAVWLCLAIPSAGGALMEAGVEKLLAMKTSGKLGSIPVISVFTKYDELVDRANFEMDPSRIEGLSNDAVLAIAKREAEQKLEVECIDPFKRQVGDAVPHVTVSTLEGYEDTVECLVTLTYNSVEEFVSSEPAIVSAMAQQVSPVVKIRASIAVGRKKYWNGLASGTNFLGKSLKTCLNVIHVDIVAVWKFKDPACYLGSMEFQTLMYTLVDSLADQEPVNPNRTLSVGLSMLGTIAGIVSALAGPAAPIVVPIAASTVLAAWLYQLYKQSDDTLRRLMAYIVDLTLIMQNLFWLVNALDNRPPITRRLIKLALKSYEDSQKAQVHSEIREYVRKAGISDRNRDGVLDKIVELIKGNCIESTEMTSLKAQIGNIDFSVDELWGVGI